jgi:hypothetical protein
VSERTAPTNFQRDDAIAACEVSHPARINTLAS